MAASESRRLVVLALIANAAIAVTKFIAAGISGSAAMLSEGIHSVADTGNQVMLLRGDAASRYDPDARHPFGRGKEIYFWAFMVAVFLFVGGSVLSIVTGIDAIRHADEHGEAGLIFNLVVLAVAAFFEIFIAFRPAVRQFNRQRMGRGVWTTLKESKDPALIVVLFEDCAAVVGLVIAAAGVILTEVTGNGVWDGIASVLIGVLLAVAAWVIAIEMKALLVGEAASREDRASIRAATFSVEQVHSIARLLTMQLSTHQILVNMDLVFDEGLSDDDIEQAVVEVERRIQAGVPSATRIFIEPVAP
jgi:cation diffusion facilitator family transporter